MFIYVLSRSPKTLGSLYTIEELRNFLELFLSISFPSLVENPPYQYFLAIH